MKTFLVCTLLALVPFSSLRMVCVTTHGLDARMLVTGDPLRAAESTEVRDAADECERVCKRHPGTVPATASPASQGVRAGRAETLTCLLVADPTCEFLTTAAVAVIPALPELPRAPSVASIRATPPSRYVSPAPTAASPPPKAIA